jgi:isopentenyldiphosphate isomerase
MIIIKNPDDQIYLAQRSAKRPDLPDYFPPPFPLTWDCTMAGHPRRGQNGYLARAVEELKEELHLKIKPESLRWLGKYPYSAPDPAFQHPRYAQYNKRLKEIEVCGIYATRTKQKPRPDPVEIAQVRCVYADRLKREADEYFSSNVEVRIDKTVAMETLPQGQSLTPWFTAIPEITAKQFKTRGRMLSPWFIWAHRFHPEIYESDFPKTKV